MPPLLEFDVEEGPRKRKTLKSTNKKRQHLLMNWIRLRRSYEFAITSINTLHFELRLSYDCIGIVYSQDLISKLNEVHNNSKHFPRIWQIDISWADSRALDSCPPPLNPNHPHLHQHLHHHPPPSV